jgi:hypothetical protein
VPLHRQTAAPHQTQGSEEPERQRCPEAPTGCPPASFDPCAPCAWRPACAPQQRPYAPGLAALTPAAPLPAQAYGTDGKLNVSYALTPAWG